MVSRRWCQVDRQRCSRVVLGHLGGGVMGRRSNRLPSGTWCGLLVLLLSSPGTVGDARAAFVASGWPAVGGSPAAGARRQQRYETQQQSLEKSAFARPQEDGTAGSQRQLRSVVLAASQGEMEGRRGGGEEGGGSSVLEQVMKLPVEAAGSLKLVDLREAVRAAGLRPGARSKAELIAMLESEGLFQKPQKQQQPPVQQQPRPAAAPASLVSSNQRQQSPPPAAAAEMPPSTLGRDERPPSPPPSDGQGMYSMRQQQQQYQQQPYRRPPPRQQRGGPADVQQGGDMSAAENAYLRKKRNKAEASAAKLAKSRRRSMPRLDAMVGDKLREQYGLPVGAGSEDVDLDRSELSSQDREALHATTAAVAEGQMAEEEDVEAGGLPAYTVGNSTGCDVELCFLGTASCVPSVTRSVSCIALRSQGTTWLFDVGEGSQVQVQRSQIKPSRINKIFITHAHGDHTFGLPGIMCLMGMEREQFEDVPVDIYGPEGLRLYIRTTVRYTLSRIVPRYRVHELKDIPMLHKRGRWAPSYSMGMDESALPPDTRFGEVEGGQDLYPDANGVYTLVDDGNVVVQAAPMVHTVPCVGFVVTEKPKPGRLRAEYVSPIVARNREALVKQGVADPNKMFRLLKSLRPGEEVPMPDGTILRAEDVLEDAKPGRKVVVCGDTCDAGKLESIAMNADVLIHESTNAFLPPFDKGTYDDVYRFAVAHGHSTPQMAGEFAKRIRARTLVLTHFSPRYKGDASPESRNIMRRLEDMARRASGMAGDRVIAAHDLMLVPVPARKQLAAEPAPRDREEERRKAVR